jgi:SNF2 family DNA or RNA helicase
MRYRFRTTPYRHQREAVRKLVKNKFGGALLMEPRTGKTKTTIDYASILNQAGKINAVFIVCPARVMDVWVKEFYDHCPRRFQIHVWDADARTSGGRPQGIPAPMPGMELMVVITNFETFNRPGKKIMKKTTAKVYDKKQKQWVVQEVEKWTGRYSQANGRFKNRRLVQQWLSRVGPTLAVLDESHKIKSASGRASVMLVSMRNDFAYRVIATGTPITKAKRSFDIYMQWQFLNPDRFKHVPDLESFKHRYGKWRQREWGQEYRGAQRMDELQKLLLKDSYMVKREDCFDLPKRDIEIIEVDLKQTGKIYDDLATEMVAEIRHLVELKGLRNKPPEIREEIKTVEASIQIVLRLRLLQLTGGMVTTDEGEVIRVGSEKSVKFKAKLEDLFEKDQKAVAAARFTADLDEVEMIGEELGVPVFRLSGGVSRRRGDLQIVEFRKLNEPALFVMQPQSGSLGIDLSTASNMLWYSLTDSWVDFTQANDRIALSRNSTTFTYFLAKRTIDRVVYRALQTDGDVHKAIMTAPDALLRN